MVKSAENEGRFPQQTPNCLQTIKIEVRFELMVAFSSVVAIQILSKIAILIEEALILLFHGWHNIEKVRQ